MRVAKEGLNSTNQRSRRRACYDILDYFVLYKPATEIDRNKSFLHPTLLKSIALFSQIFFYFVLPETLFVFCINVCVIDR